jgi:hypothetical protein
MVNAGFLDHKIGTITVSFTPQVIEAVGIVAQSTVVETLYKISVCDDARGLSPPNSTIFKGVIVNFDCNIRSNGASQPDIQVGRHRCSWLRIG